MNNASNANQVQRDSRGSERAGPRGGMLVKGPKMIGRNLNKRLDRLEARVLADRAKFMRPRYILAHIYGGPAEGPICVAAPDGRDVWWKPPAGCKVGDELAKCGDDPESDLLPVYVVVCESRIPGGGKAPTTAIGPDGRLVWLEPPAGCKAGEPIEDSAAATASFGAEPRQGSV